jgi:hypothetical protein
MDVFFPIHRGSEDVLPDDVEEGWWVV